MPEYAVVWRDNAAVHLAKGELTPTGVRIFFWVKDVNALYEELIGRRVAIEVPIETRHYGVRDFSFATRTVLWWSLGKTGTEPARGW